MSYLRSYFEKNNTIIKGSTTNTAKNPTTEIYYGNNTFSKFIFKVDFTDLIGKLSNGELTITDINVGSTKVSHTLHLTNCIFGDEGFKGQGRSTGRQRATSFDLILFEITEEWDEGVGFDYVNSPSDTVDDNTVFNQNPSNWYNRTTTNEWATSGIYAENPSVISIIHFDNGNENINLNLTSYINQRLRNEVLNFGTKLSQVKGFGLAFSLPYQDLTPEYDKSVSFFTKYTQTFFEPYVETFINDRIDDNRTNFAAGVYNYLYLYVTKGTNFYNLDTMPVVNILDSNGNIIEGLDNQQEVDRVKKGVYRVKLGIDGNLCDGKRFFYDEWTNLSIDGIEIADVKQKFIPKPFTSQYTIGENQTELQRYKIQYFGIKQNEKIVRGELRKVVVTIKSIDIQKSNLFDEVYFRMFIKEGTVDVIVHDWTLIDKTNENSFYLDTSIYIPREYFIEIKAKTHTEEIFYNEYIKFEILSQKPSLVSSNIITPVPTSTPTITPTPLPATSTPVPTGTPTTTPTSTPQPATSTPTPTSTSTPQPATVTPTSTPQPETVTPTPTSTSTPQAATNTPTPTPTHTNTPEPATVTPTPTPTTTQEPATITPTPTPIPAQCWMLRNEDTRVLNFSFTSYDGEIGTYNIPINGILKICRREGTDLIINSPIDGILGQYNCGVDCSDPNDLYRCSTVGTNCFPTPMPGDPTMTPPPTTQPTTTPTPTPI